MAVQLSQHQVLKLESVTPPILFFFFNIVLGIQGPLEFHMNLRIGFSLSAKKKKKSHWNFDRECVESIHMYITWGSTALLKIFSLSICEHGMFSHFIRSNSFQQCFTVFSVQVFGLLGLIYP